MATQKLTIQMLNDAVMQKIQGGQPAQAGDQPAVIQGLMDRAIGNTVRGGNGQSGQ